MLLYPLLLMLRIAFEEDRILITRDKDFGELVFRLHKLHAGVILIRLEGYTTQERGKIVCTTVKLYLDKLSDAFTVIQPKLVRIRKGDS